jgi:hypothetical protein
MIHTRRKTNHSFNMAAVAQAGTGAGLAARPGQANWNLTDAQATKGKDAQIT